jgi:hypothetical protein
VNFLDTTRNAGILHVVKTNDMPAPRANARHGFRVLTTSATPRKPTLNARHQRNSIADDGSATYSMVNGQFSHRVTGIIKHTSIHLSRGFNHVQTCENPKRPYCCCLDCFNKMHAGCTPRPQAFSSKAVAFASSFVTPSSV